MKQTHRQGLTQGMVRLGPSLPSPRDKHGFLIRPGLTMKVKEGTWEGGNGAALLKLAATSHT